jgi:hypothetical protein
MTVATGGDDDRHLVSRATGTQTAAHKRYRAELITRLAVLGRAPSG